MHCSDPQAFVKYSNEIDYIYEIIDEYNPNKKLKILIAFDCIIADKFNNKFNPIFIGGGGEGG